MPALVGGFGNISSESVLYNYLNKMTTTTIIFNRQNYSMLALSAKNIALSCPSSTDQSVSTALVKFNLDPEKMGGYLAGLIEGDGTIAVHDKNSTATKYRPMIIIVFKKADLPLAEYLQKLTNCGVVQIKPDRGYVLWQISDIVGVYTIVNIINGYMRTPKIEALNRTIDWINDYIDNNNNKNSKLPSTKSILSKINKIDKKSIDNSPIDLNPWLSGFTDADGNFSINITKRSDKKLAHPYGRERVQLYYRLEIRQTYHRLDNEEVSYYAIMSKIGAYLGSNILSRSRIVGDKTYFSFIVTAFSKYSLKQTTDYFNKFPLLSSKYLDYLSWCKILELQLVNSKTTSYLDSALQIRTNFNKTRTIYNWDHLKNSYLIHTIK